METPFKEAEDFFSELYLGKHHIPGKIKAYGPGWHVNHLGSLATFDFNELTRLVFLAHDQCMRVEIINSGPGMVKIAIWKREGRTGSMWQRHPTIDEALKQWRESHKETPHAN